MEGQLWHKVAKISKLAVLLILVVNLFSVQSVAALSKKFSDSYMIIIDASGSMDGNLRMERAKEAAEKFILSNKGKNVEMGLIAFYDCSDIRVLHELTPNVEDLIQPLRGIYPSGLTPIAGSISVGANYLKTNGQGAKGKIMLYTDGVESCDGDFQSTRESLDGLSIDIWSLDLTDEAKLQFENQIGIKPEDVEKQPEISKTLSGISAEPFPPMEIGQIFQISIKAKWSDGSSTDVPLNEVTFSSLREDRVAVSAEGVMSALNIGASYIDVEYEGHRLRLPVNVNPLPEIKSISLENKFPDFMTEDDSYPIGNVVVTWSNGETSVVDSKEVIYKSSQEDRVKVTENGILHAEKQGTSFIDIEYKGKKIRSLVTINPKASLSEFYLEQALPSKMSKGQQYSINGLKAKWSDGNITDIALGDAVIKSSQPGRIDVANEALMALNEGTSYIDIEYRGKKIRSLVMVEAAAAVTSLYLDKAIPSTMIRGEKYTLSGLKAKWSDGSITDILPGEASVISTQSSRVQAAGNELEALSEGPAYIDIVYAGKKVRTLITVNAEATISSFYLDPFFPAKFLTGDHFIPTGLKAQWSDGTIRDVDISEVSIISSRVDRIQLINNNELKAISKGTSYIDFLYKGKKIRKLVTVE